MTLSAFVDAAVNRTFIGLQFKNSANTVHMFTDWAGALGLLAAHPGKEFLVAIESYNTSPVQPTLTIAGVYATAVTTQLSTDGYQRITWFRLKADLAADITAGNIVATFSSSQTIVCCAVYAAYDVGSVTAYNDNSILSFVLEVAADESRDGAVVVATVWQSVSGSPTITYTGVTADDNTVAGRPDFRFGCGSTLTTTTATGVAIKNTAGGSTPAVGVLSVLVLKP